MINTKICLKTCNFPFHFRGFSPPQAAKMGFASVLQKSPFYRGIQNTRSKIGTKKITERQASKQSTLLAKENTHQITQLLRSFFFFFLICRKNNVFSLLIQSTKNQRVDFVALNAPEIFERSRSLAFQKSIEGSCVCLDLSCKCLKKKAEVCCVFLLRMKAPVELHAFYLYSEGMEFARFQSCSLTEKLVQIFRPWVFSSSNHPPNAYPNFEAIRRPFIKNSPIHCRAYNGRTTDYERSDLSLGGFIKSRIVNWTYLSENNIND